MTGEGFENQLVSLEGVFRVRVAAERLDHVLKADAFGDIQYFINNGRPAGGADIGSTVGLGDGAFAGYRQLIVDPSFLGLVFVTIAVPICAAMIASASRPRASKISRLRTESAGMSSIFQSMA